MGHDPIATSNFGNFILKISDFLKNKCRIVEIKKNPKVQKYPNKIEKMP